MTEGVNLMVARVGNEIASMNIIITDVEFAIANVGFAFSIAIFVIAYLKVLIANSIFGSARDFFLIEGAIFLITVVEDVIEHVRSGIPLQNF